MGYCRHALPARSVGGAHGARGRPVAGHVAGRRRRESDLHAVAGRGLLGHPVHGFSRARASSPRRAPWSADGPAVTILLLEHEGKPINTFLAYDLNGRMLVPAAGMDHRRGARTGPPALQKE
ncbi:MAG: hypothetical protein MZV64_30240 [Ignavibacteriales bacterium]|nr:hypothetical protein [Ignavibacteriales bacterium]